MADAPGELLVTGAVVADATGTADGARETLDVVVVGAVEATGITSLDAGATGVLDAGSTTEDGSSIGIRTDSDDCGAAGTADWGQIVGQL